MAKKDERDSLQTKSLFQGKLYCTGILLYRGFAHDKPMTSSSQKEREEYKMQPAKEENQPAVAILCFLVKLKQKKKKQCSGKRETLNSFCRAAYVSCLSWKPRIH